MLFVYIAVVFSPLYTRHVGRDQHSKPSATLSCITTLIIVIILYDIIMLE